MDPSFPEQITHVLYLPPPTTDVVVIFGSGAWRKILLIFEEQQVVRRETVQVSGITRCPGEWTTIKNGLNLSQQSAETIISKSLFFDNTHHNTSR